METDPRFARLGKFSIGLALVSLVRLAPEFLRVFRRGDLQPMYFGAAGAEGLLILLGLVAGLGLMKHRSWGPGIGAAAWGAVAAHALVFYWHFYHLALGPTGHHLVFLPRVAQYAVTLLGTPEVVRTFAAWKGLPPRSELLIIGLVSAACSATLALSIIFLPTAL